MLKRGAIGSYCQNQALRAHVWVKDGPKTAETRPDSDQRDLNRKLCLNLKTHPGWTEMPILLI
jgi:hypothetical protein